MTQQSYDWVFWNGKRFVLLGDSSNQLPLKEDLGVQLEYRSTACWRGYQAEYDIDENELFLSKIYVASAKTLDRFPVIHGVQPNLEFNYVLQPSRPEKDRWGDVYYSPKLKMPITGYISLFLYGDDDRDLHRQNQSMKTKETKFIKVHLREGNIFNTEDVTQQAKDIYQNIEQISTKRRDSNDTNLDAEKFETLLDQLFNLLHTFRMLYPLAQQ